MYDYNACYRVVEVSPEGRVEYVHVAQCHVNENTRKKETSGGGAVILGTEIAGPSWVVTVK